MAAETRDDVAAETSNVETVHLSEERENMEYCLIEIMKEHRVDKRKAEPEPPKRRIPKVDNTLRQTESNKRCFEPLVVSFGPYHHGEDHLKPMEPYKNDAAAWFISHAKEKPAKDVADAEAISVYKQFIENVKNVSSESPTDNWYEFIFKSEEHFIWMMFLDGCFILYFIHLVTGSSSDNEYIFKSTRLHFNQASIVRDMFLLENQIPFPILKSLMSLIPDQKMTGSSIMKFIYTVFLPSYEIDFSRNISLAQDVCLRVKFWIYKLFSPSVWNDIFDFLWESRYPVDREPLHLLHVLREVLVGERDSSDSAGGNAGYWNYSFRPIRELKAAAIQVRRSRGMTLEYLEFEWGLLNSHLEIPQIIVDDSTMTRLLNLAAYEMCPDGPKDRTVTSYICLLDSLIDHADDVAELQNKNILLNRFGSGEAVSKLFKDLAANLSPDSNAYAHVSNGIRDHYRRHFNYERTRIGKWIGQFIRTYFSSPWSLISLIAAAFIIVLTLLQTIYTMWGFYKTD